jgi:hypothetical protein
MRSYQRLSARLAHTMRAGDAAFRHGSVVGEIISAGLPAAWAAGKIMGRISI